MTKVITFIPSAVPSVEVPDINLNNPAFLVYLLEDGTHYFCHTAEPRSFIYKTFCGCASHYLKGNRPVEIIRGVNGSMGDVLTEYEEYFFAQHLLGVDSVKFCPKTASLDAIHTKLVQDGLQKIEEEHKDEELQKHIDAEVQRKLEAVMVQQEVNVRPTEQLLTAKALAGQTSNLTPNRLNQLVQNEGFHTPYRENGTQYWVCTAKGKASPLIDDVPIGSGTITTTRFTHGIFTLPSIMDAL